MAVLTALPAVAVAVPAAAVTAPTVALYPDGSGIPPTRPAVHGAVSDEFLIAYGQLPAGTTSAHVQRRTGPSGAWTGAGNTPGTGPTYFSFLRAPVQLGHYQFRTVAKGSYGTVVSAIWKLDVVVQRNTFAFTTTSTAGLVEGVGSVTPARPGRTLHAQVMESGAWRNVATVPQDGQGRYRFRVMPRGTGARVYRTAPVEPGNGSAPSSIQVLPAWPPFAPVDLTRVDSVYGRIPVRGDTFVIGSAPNTPTSMIWALPGGRRTFQATLRATAPDPYAAVQIAVWADDRILLVATVPPGQELPMSLDITGASRLIVGVGRDRYSEWELPQALLIRPRLTSRPVSSPLPPAREYLANLTPVARTACVVVEGVDVGSGRPGSLHWGSLGQECPDGAAIEYELGGGYVRLQAGTGVPENGGAGLPNIDGGAVTVLGDDRVLGYFPVPNEGPVIDLDVTGVQRLRFVFSRNAGAMGGEMAVLTPAVLRR